MSTQGSQPPELGHHGHDHRFSIEASIEGSEESCRSINPAERRLGMMRLRRVDYDKVHKYTLGSARGANLSGHCDQPCGLDDLADASGDKPRANQTFPNSCAST